MAAFLGESLRSHNFWMHGLHHSCASHYLHADGRHYSSCDLCGRCWSLHHSAPSNRLRDNGSGASNLLAAVLNLLLQRLLLPERFLELQINRCSRNRSNELIGDKRLRELLDLHDELGSEGEGLRAAVFGEARVPWAVLEAVDAHQDHLSALQGRDTRQGAAGEHQPGNWQG